MAKKIKVAIVGVGNCAKSFYEGVSFYSDNPQEKIGLMHFKIGGYSVSDIEVVAAFDIDERKVGKPLHEAINAEPNHTIKITDPHPSKVIVKRGPTYDSVTEEAREYYIHESNLKPVDVAKELKESGAEVVINYLPTGSDQAASVYAEAALEAGCSFINCMPAHLARDPKWQKRFIKKGLVLIGDDIKSQLGATIVNRVCLELLKSRGFLITHSDQTNIGGNADFLNLHLRPHSKEESKKASLNSILSKDDAVPVARLVYAKKNFDHKRTSIYITGEMFGGISASVHALIDDEDSPNSAGIVVDAVRAARVLKETGKIEHTPEISAYLMKAPSVQLPEADAYEKFQKILK